MYTNEELADMQRDVAALIIARIDGDAEAIDAVLAGTYATAGQRGLAAVTQSLLVMYHDALLRLTIAASLMPDSEYAQVTSPEYEEMASHETLRHAVKASVSAMQRGILDDSADSG